MTIPTASTRGRAARRRGHDAERMVVAYLRAAGWQRARTWRRALGRDGFSTLGDIDWVWSVVLEVKSVERAAFPAWCRQAAEQADLLAQLPVVVRRARGVPDVGAWPCRWRVAEALDLDLDLVPDEVHMVDGEPWGAALFARLVAAVAEHESRGEAGARRRHPTGRGAS